MPTDYACQSAVELAARGIAPVRAYVTDQRQHTRSAPEPVPPEPQDVDLPPTLRAYLGQGYPSTRAAEPVADAHTVAEGRAFAGEPPEPAASQAHGAAVLLLFLDGVRADLAGSLAAWRAGLGGQLSRIIGLEDEGNATVGAVSGWRALSDVQRRAQEVLTALAEVPRTEPLRSGELYQRLAVVEDVVAAMLGRLSVPEDLRNRCVGELAGATGSLFGFRQGW